MASFSRKNKQNYRSASRRHGVLILAERLDASRKQEELRKDPVSNLKSGNRRRFASWVRSYGFTRLARELGTDRVTVHRWVAGARGRHVAPTMAFMVRIIELSEREAYDYGPLTYDDMLAGTVGLRGQHGHGYASVKPSPYTSRKRLMAEVGVTRKPSSKRNLADRSRSTDRSLVGALLDQQTKPKRLEALIKNSCNTGKSLDYRRDVAFGRSEREEARKSVNFDAGDY